jgi:fibronectin-binding autotransporter adhesin
VKRIFLVPAFFALSLAVALSGCGSSGSSVPNSGAGGTSGGGTTGSTGNSILSGKYAFSLTGSATETGAPIFEAGSFTADGNGNITAGEEDLNILPSNITAASQVKGATFTGTYSIGSDGRGLLTFTTLSQTYKIVIENGGHGQLIRFDSGAAGSGTFDLQTTSAFTLSALQQGNFVFEWNGFDPSDSDAPISGIGGITLSGASASGAGDFNDGGTYVQATASTTLTAPDTNGHGTATIVYGFSTPITVTYGYDIISASRILLIETDATFGTVGEADAQSSGLTATSLSGNYALSLGGENTVGVVGLAGRIAASGGSITSSDVVENDNFATAAGTFTSGIYTASNVVGTTTVSGRFLLSATDPSLSADNFAVYLISPSKAMVMETDSSQLLFGQMLTQTLSSFTSGSLSGNYGMNFSGFDSSFFEADVLGQFTSSGASTLTAGTVDINYQALTTPTVPNNAISGGSYVVVTDATGHGTLTFTADSVAFAFHFYFVSPNQIFLVETDHEFVSTGSALSQPTIP